MINWHIGCSGFAYKHWKGMFYPADLPQKKWFEFYCQHFNTLELNVTFYRFPRLNNLQNWYKISPANFHFAVKAPKAITHYKKFIGTANMLSDFYNTTRDGLAEKLGCVLFQLPPNYLYSEERLERILKSLDNSFLNVVEFRHQSWWREEVYAELGRNNISFCGMSHPDFPNTVVAATSLLYYRFHGEDQLYASNYPNTRLEEVLGLIKGFEKVDHAYIFFNNDIDGFAISNARYVQQMVKAEQPLIL